MPRFSKLKNWPENLERLSKGELERELAFWRHRVGQFKSAKSKREVAKRAATIAAVIERRFGGAT